MSSSSLIYAIDVLFTLSLTLIIFIPSKFKLLHLIEGVNSTIFRTHTHTDVYCSLHKRLNKFDLIGDGYTCSRRRQWQSCYTSSNKHNHVQNTFLFHHLPLIPPPTASQTASPPISTYHIETHLMRICFSFVYFPSLFNCHSIQLINTRALLHKHTFHSLFYRLTHKSKQ